MTTAQVEVLGVRHHGPGSARSVGEALDELQPDVVLVEGAPELDQVIALLGDPGMRPPVAGLVYAVDQPRRAMFYPLAEFSPEWVAVRWALAHQVPVRFADLPAVHQLVDPPETTDPPDLPDLDAATQGEDEDDELDDLTVEPGAPPARTDPIGTLAAAAGYDDPERWWEDVVEHRGTSTLERFAAVKDAMAAVRESDERADDDPDVVENARREAAMRRAIRTASKAGAQRIAFVCGAYHAPALDPGSFPPATRDNALLAGLPKAKVAATWAPWTSGRLALASGYGAGVTSPGWYQHLFQHWSQRSLSRDPVDPGDAGGNRVERDESQAIAASWLVRVARELRGQQIDASTASVVEATRLATTLATVRGRPSVGLSELDDAAESVLCEGSRVPLMLVHDTLVVGRDLGAVPDAAPSVPIASDLARQQRQLRLKPTASETTVTLDLRRDNGLARSQLLHRLRLLGVDWGTPVDAGRSSGTFKEAWSLAWQPELAVAVIEAGLFGTTVTDAAAAKVADLAERATDLATLGRLVSECLLADLPDGLRAVVDVLAERTARQHDVLALLGTIDPLARTVRYGDVRGVDVAGVAHVLDAIVTRSSIGLPAACSSLDDEAATALRSAIDSAQRGIALLEDDDLRARWIAALASVAIQSGVHGSVSGRVNRLLLDAGRIGQAEAAIRLSRRLSVAAPAPEAAAWVDGFLAGESALLIHDPTLLGIIDDWVSSIAEDTFDDLLPLLRRTFSRFSRPERRLIGEQVSRLGTSATSTAAESAGHDLDRARPAMMRVASLLGLAAEQ